VAVARAPHELGRALGVGGQRLIAVPREFPLGNQPVDCLFVTEECRVILVECKLHRNPELRGEVAEQVCRYVTELRKINALSLRGDLIAYLKRYGLKWRQVLTQEIGVAAIQERFWSEVDTNLKAGRIDVVIAADWLPAETALCLTRLRRRLPETANCSLVRVEKSQASDRNPPSFRIISAEPGSGGTDEGASLWTPVSTRRWRLIDLPKRQPRVDRVRPPAELQVDDTVTWARNLKPEENHALDPARTASFIPVMPNVGLLAATGMPYPASDRDPTVEPLPVDYRPWLVLGRVVWERIRMHGRFEHPSDTVDTLSMARKEAPAFAQHPRSDEFGERGVLTALRGLHLFGLGCLCRKPKRRWLFVRDDPAEVTMG
jgi:hypothetical protein